MCKCDKTKFSTTRYLGFFSVIFFLSREGGIGSDEEVSRNQPTCLIALEHEHINRILEFDRVQLGNRFSKSCNHEGTVLN